jgi:hypothetical protein
MFRIGDIIVDDYTRRYLIISHEGDVWSGLRLEINAIMIEAVDPAIPFTIVTGS